MAHTFQTNVHSHMNVKNSQYILIIQIDVP